MEKYSSYKDSGEQWLGEIPGHWAFDKVKHLYEMQTGFTPNTKVPEYYTDEKSNVWVNIADIKGRTISDSASHISDLYIKQFKPNIVPKGSLLYSFKLSVGEVAIAEKDLYTNEAIASFLPNDKVDLNFLYYSAPVYIVKNANENIYGAKILNQNLIKNALIVFPPLPEQRAIVSYLDRVTAQIDEAIERSQRMIDLLNERKQIIIQHAVTKGLDANAKLKDSGVKWIGEVPKGWEIEPFGRHFKFGKGLTITKENLQEEGIAVISYGQIHAKSNTGTTLTEDLTRRVSPKYLDSSPQSLLNLNDFIFADTSEDTAGAGNMVINDYKEPIFAGYHTVIARPLNLKYPKYYAYLFMSMGWKSQIQSLVNGVKVYSIGKRILKSSYILIPSEKEQKDIVSYLDDKIEVLDSAIASETHQISLLRERKQIIINEVVTGKVKVI